MIRRHRKKEWWLLLLVTELETMASSSSLISASLLLLPTRNPALHRHNRKISPFIDQNQSRRAAFKALAAKIPAGVEVPRVEPQFKPPFLGFTKTAEIWNSRACMIGLIGTFIVELIIHKGILQVIGVEIGKGLDIPL